MKSLNLERLGENLLVNLIAKETSVIWDLCQITYVQEMS